MQMQKFEVGKIFKEGKTKYDEGIKFDYDQSGAILFIYYQSPTNKEIESIRDGKLKIGLLSLKGIMFMLFKFGELPWMDAPYHYKLSKEYTLEDTEQEQGYGMTVFFIDADTGILKVIRFVGWDYRLSKNFRSIVDAQAQEHFDINSYRTNLANLYKVYTTKDLVDLSSVYNTINRGGDKLNG